MNSFVAVIPARMSSSRLPGKALADIHGKPMVVRVAERAQASHAERVVVATDHTDIAQACQQYGIETVMTSSHHESGTTRLAEAISLLKMPSETIVVNVQGDEPLIAPTLIDQIATVLATSDAPMATAAHTIDNVSDFINPNIVKVVQDKNGNALYFSRAPIAYPRDMMQANGQNFPKEQQPLRHIGLYAYRAGFLQDYAALTPSPIEYTEALEQLRVLWHGYPIAVKVVAEAPAAGVDTPADLETVRAVWQPLSASK